MWSTCVCLCVCICLLVFLCVGHDCELCKNGRIETKKTIKTPVKIKITVTYLAQLSGTACQTTLENHI